MAKQTTEEDVIFNLNINQADLSRELTNSKKQIIDTKEALSELTKEYNKGNITIDEYAKLNVALTQQLKSEQKTYNDLTKAVNTNSNSINALAAQNKKLKNERNNLDLSTQKGIKRLNDLNKEIDQNDAKLQKNLSLLEKQKVNIGNYAAAVDVLVPGLGQLVSQVNTLGQAYQASEKAIASAGLSLRAFNAIPVLSIITGITTAFQLLNQIIKENGEATAEAIVNVVNAYEYSEAVLRNLDIAINEAEEERKKGLDEAIKSSDIYADKLNRLAKISEDQGASEANSIQERIDLLNSSINLYQKEADTRTKSITDYLASVTLVDKEAGITESLISKDERQDLQNRLDSITDSYKRISSEIREQIQDLQSLQQFSNPPSRGISELQDSTNPVFGTGIVDQDRIEAEQQIRTKKYLNDAILKLDEEKNIQEVKNRRDSLDEIKKLEEQGLITTANILDQAATIAEEGSALQQSLSITSALIKTYEAANVALASAPPPLNFILMAATIATGLVNAGKIAGFESGGYTGSGRNNEPAGVVHRNEVVWNAADVAAVGGPSRANSMRPTARSRNSSGGGYQDGGIVTQGATRDTNSALVTANILKNAPPAVVSVKEITRVQSRIRAKETVSSS